ncbi:MAG: helix-turn-helix domain-containing protein, partial [Muribaculaceae bacterium]|nr:helix-turn-helix domain-containing protein [Muribaculaceae bacterium]
QLLMIGDLQQLAPVLTPQDEALLRPHYSTPYFFGSKALAQIQYVTIELQKVYRQQNRRFVELLNDIRDNRLTEEDSRLLNSRLDPDFTPSADSGFIRLTTHNATADSYNSRELARLKAPVRRYKADIQKNFPEMIFPTSSELELKAGAQVMFIKNDPEKRFYNGKIGTVVSTDADSVKVICHDDADGTECEPITVEPQMWENTRYTVDEATNTIMPEVQGTFSQLPLRLAWAITIHKSQGLTFPRVIIDAGAAFAPGQVYVALSRCTSLEGIVLATPIGAGIIGGDPAVNSYIAGQQEAAARSAASLPAIKQDYYRSLMLDMFNFGTLVSLQESLHRVMSQTFSHAFPKETARQAEIAITLREKVVDVADKWIAVISSQSFEALTSQAMLDRVCRSALYFQKELTGIFGDSLTAAARVRTDNKKASQRVKDLVADIRASLGRWNMLLGHMGSKPFSIPVYLQCRQAAALDSGKENALKKLASGTSSPSRKRKTEKKAREPRQMSHDITFGLFSQGLTRHEIAEQRGLTVSTVSEHLMKFVEKGSITLHDLLTPVVINQVRSALEQSGPEVSYNELRRLLPDNIVYWDIKAVQQLLREEDRNSAAAKVTLKFGAD